MIITARLVMLYQHNLVLTNLMQRMMPLSQLLKMANEQKITEDKKIRIINKMYRGQSAQQAHHLLDV